MISRGRGGEREQVRGVSPMDKDRKQSDEKQNADEATKLCAFVVTIATESAKIKQLPKTITCLRSISSCLSMSTICSTSRLATCEFAVK